LATLKAIVRVATYGRYASDEGLIETTSLHTHSEMEGVEVEGRDSFHPQKPMNKGIQKNGGGLEQGWNIRS
jgi:hypothetical protein